MYQECHAHIFMDGQNYAAAAKRCQSEPDEADIRRKLSIYQKCRVDYIRDGGDHYGAAALAACIAPEYGIEYRSPAFAIYRKGQYGGIVGKSYETMKEFHHRVLEAKNDRADFIKIMLSGILDFNRGGCVTGQSREKEEIREMIHIAHEEGFAVMAHVNGDIPVRSAIEAGADSIEHGFFMSKETIGVLADSETIWVPTVSAVANILGSGRFSDEVIAPLVKTHKANIGLAMKLGAAVAPGSDAGAFCVLHGKGALQERQQLTDCAGSDKVLQERINQSVQQLRLRFNRH